MSSPWKSNTANLVIDQPLPAVVEEVLRSIEGLTGDEKAAQNHTPRTLVQADEVVQFGALAFAFDDPASALASNRPLEGFRPAVYRLYLACARARLDFVNHHTVTETWQADPPEKPSKSLFIALVYLHNLWVLCTDDHAGLPGLYQDKTILDFYEPMYAFPRALHAHQKPLHLDDLITLHAVVLRFLSLYQERLAPTEGTARFEDPLHQYATMRSQHPMPLLLLDQLVALSPLSRLWLLPEAPLHVDTTWAGVGRWARGCEALFTRAARPLLMMLADYLIFTLFRPATREAEDDDWKSRYQMHPRLDALHLFNQFLERTQARYGLHPVYVDFRVLCCYYFYQSSLLLAADNNRWGQAEAIITFIEHCRWISKPTRTAPPPQDTLDHTLHRMRTRLTEAAFDEQCRGVLEQWE